MPEIRSACSVSDAHVFIKVDAHPNLGFSRGAYTARALAGMLNKVSFVIEVLFTLFSWCHVGWTLAKGQRSAGQLCLQGIYPD